MRHSTAYSEVASCRFASRQPLADLVHDLMFPSSQSRNRSVLDSLFLEFDGHDWLVARTEGEATGVVKISGYQSVSQLAARGQKQWCTHYGWFEVREGLFCFRVR